MERGSFYTEKGEHVGSRDECRGSRSMGHSVLRYRIKQQKNKLYLGKRGLEGVKSAGSYLSSLS